MRHGVCDGRKKSIECTVTVIPSDSPDLLQFGRHRAQEDHRDMWSEAVRVLRETRPKAFIFENVKGLKRQTFTTYLNYILLQLQHPSIEMKNDESWADRRQKKLPVAAPADRVYLFAALAVLP
jgi:hypothetical protein